MVFTTHKRLMALGALLMVALGFLLMSGGGTESPNAFNPELFSFRRITLAPLVVVAGYVLMLVAIMRKPQNNAEA